MKKVFRMIFLALILMVVSKNITPIEAVTVYINEPASVPISVSFSELVAGTYEISTGQLGKLGDHLEDNYVTSTTITADFTPTELGEYTITVTFDLTNSDENEVVVPPETVVVMVVNRVSTNNNLASLSTNVGTINFNKNTTSYTIVVNNDVTNATISASLEDSTASLNGTGTKALEIYSNNIQIQVTAEDGSVKTYTINIVRRDEKGLTGPLSKNNDLASLVVEGCLINFSKNVLEYNCEVDNLIENVLITAKAEDSKASVVIDKPEKLKVENNEIKIKVIAENEVEKIYILNVRRSSLAPTIEMAELEDALGKLTGDEIGVYDTGVVSKETLELIKEHKKVLYVYKYDNNGKLLYEWKFDGRYFDETVDVNTHLSFESEYLLEINEASNYARGVVLKFEANPSLPQNTMLGVFVGDQFKDGTKINVYYFNPESNELEIIHKDLEVIEKWVRFPLSHTSEYFVTPALLTIQNDTNDLWLFVAIGTSLLSLLLAGYIVFLKTKRVYRY